LDHIIHVFGISFKTALHYDVIATKARFNPFSKINFQALAALSEKRVQTNTRFIEIKAANQQINSIYNNPKKPTRLALKDVFYDAHEMDSLWKKIKKIVDTESTFTLVNNSFDTEQLKFDDFQQDINKYKIKEVKNNPYLEEAISILNDYYTLTK